MYPKSYPRMRAISRLIAGITVNENECWVWNKAKSGAKRGGYGCFVAEGKTTATRIFAYEFFIGKVPEGLELDHLCRNRACCNPWHLEPVTHLENIQRGNTGQHMLLKTHCVQGHELIEANIYWYKDKKGNKHRHCKMCRENSSKAHRARKKMLRANSEL